MHPLQGDVQPIDLDVQQPVQHAKNEVLDDAAFVSDTDDDKAVSALCEDIPDDAAIGGVRHSEDTAEDEEVNRLCAPVEEPKETPNPYEIGLTKRGTTGRQMSTHPAATVNQLSGTASSLEADHTMVAEAVQPSQPQPKKRRKRSAAPVEEGQFTRDGLGEKLGIKRDAVKAWEDKGKLAELGWERVEGTGTGTSNPVLYQRKLES